MNRLLTNKFSLFCIRLRDYFRNLIKCKTNHHDYRSVQRLSPIVIRAKCRCCNSDVAINHNLRSVIPWDAELENLYRDFNVTILEPRFSDGTPTGRLPPGAGSGWF